MTLAGRTIELDVGSVAHGGHCVARVGDEPGGRVVFVRHALPGERVRALVVDDPGGSFCRADAVEILRPSADRVVPPCAHAGPGRCGGCDWQHVSPDAQRALKARVVAEQLRRLAGIDLEVTVEPLPGGPLGWRTRTLYAVDGDGQLGLRRHRSHDVEVLDHCPLGAAGIGDSRLLTVRRPGASGVELDLGADGEVSVLEHRPGRPRGAGRGRRPPDVVQLVSGPPQVTRVVAGRTFTVTAGGFWQVHPAAAQAFADAMLGALNPQPGDRVLDLYAGAGLFTALFADAVGPGGTVIGIEGSASGVANAEANLSDLAWARVDRAAVDPASIAAADPAPDLVILDPPRAGAGGPVIDAVLDLNPRAVGYLACDPASLARDLARASPRGWALTGFRAFDAFPMTAHVECLAVLEPGPDVESAG